MEPGDSQELLILEEKTEDTGRFGFSTSYNYDYYQIQQSLRPGFIGIVAEIPDFDGLVGVGLLSFGECQVEGDLLPYSYLGGLGVHEAFRRRGISKAITSKMMEIVKERFGNECIVIAGIQGGNEGSLKANMKWANQQFSDRNCVSIGKTFQNPPKKLDDIYVRLVRDDELEEVVTLQNKFYQETNLYPPKTHTDLQAWLSKRPFGHEINRYYVAVNQKGHLLAGIGVSLLGYLTIGHVTRMPWLMRKTNTLLRILPIEEGSKSISGHWLWFGSGLEAVGGKLWESVKWREHEHANMAMLFFDNTCQISKAISLPKYLPQSSGYIVVNSHVKLKDEHCLYFNNMMI
jgi:GNAT superfamily N-acetyltransferase